MKKINKASLISRLTARFLLSRLVDEEFALGEVVTPVTVVDELTQTVSQKTPANTSITATGWYLVQTVPSGKRWVIHSVREKLSTGTWTMTAIGIEKRDNSSSQHVIKEVTSATTINYEPTMRLILEQGDKIYVYIDAYTSTGNLQTGIWYYEEDSF